MDIDKVEEELQELTTLLEKVRLAKLESYIKKLEQNLPNYLRMKELEHSRDCGQLTKDNTQELQKVRRKFMRNTINSMTFQRIEGQARKEYRSIHKLFSRWQRDSTEFHLVTEEEIYDQKNHNFLSERLHSAKWVIEGVVEHPFTEPLDIAYKRLSPILSHIRTYQSISLFQEKYRAVQEFK